jgi:hypothetical protein
MTHFLRYHFKMNRVIGVEALLESLLQKDKVFIKRALHLLEDQSR